MEQETKIRTNNKRLSGRQRKLIHKRKTFRVVSSLGNGKKRFNCRLTIINDDTPLRRIVRDSRYFRSLRFNKNKSNKLVRNNYDCIYGKGNFYKKLNKIGFDRWYDY